MKSKLCLFVLCCCYFNLQAQHEPTVSLNQLQFNGLLINPAYAGSTQTLSLDASYLGLGNGTSGSAQQLNFSIHSPLSSNEDLALGAKLDLSRFPFNNFAIVGIQPIVAYALPLGNGQLSIGGQGGFHYFDIGAGGGPAGAPTDLATLSGGLGAYYQTGKFFAGISAPKIFEAVILEDEVFSSEFSRRKSYYFHSGVVTPFRGYLLNPSVVISYNNFFILPEAPNRSVETSIETALNVNLIIDETYWLGLGYGHVNFENNAGINYLDASANVHFGDLRLGFSYHFTFGGTVDLAFNNYTAFTVGYDLPSGNEGLIRFF